MSARRVLELFSFEHVVLDEPLSSGPATHGALSGAPREDRLLREPGASRAMLLAEERP